MKLDSPDGLSRRLKTKRENVDPLSYIYKFFFLTFLHYPVFSYADPHKFGVFRFVRTIVRFGLFIPYILTTKTLQTPPIGLTRRPLDDMRSPAYHLSTPHLSPNNQTGNNNQAKPDAISV